MKEIIFFQPIFKQKLWGGSRLRTLFGMDVPGINTGECWLVSAHPQGDTLVREGSFKGRSLKYLWENHKYLFGDIKEDEFPLLIKIIDAKEDLSIQVHPHEEQILMNKNNCQGKNECWYVLDCKPDTQIILGHRAKTREELENLMKEKAWNLLLEKVVVNKGDFFYIPGGTVHALTKGMLVLEIQQSSDTTYRLYDYGRMENDSPRQLHVEKALEVIDVPHKIQQEAARQEKKEGYTKTILIEDSFFSVYIYDVESKASLFQDKEFLFMVMIEGQGHINGIEVKKGDCWMLPKNYGSYCLQGNMKLAAATKDPGSNIY